jgi:hypothetical protein
MRHLDLVLAMVLSATLSATGYAQAQPAERVRILTTNGFSITGTLAEATSDSLRIRESQDWRWVRRSDIAYLERSTRRYHRFLPNFLATVAGGAGIGGMIGAISWKECVSNEFLGCLLAPETRADAFLMGGAIGGILSVPVGVVLGLALRYDRWEPVHDGPGVSSSLSVRPVVGRGIGMSASISF